MVQVLPRVHGTVLTVITVLTRSAFVTNPVAVNEPVTVIFVAAKLGAVRLEADKFAGSVVRQLGTPVPFVP